MIKEKIKSDWSPEQIAGRFKHEGIINPHHETIYRHILDDKLKGGILYKHLRHQGKTYRKRYGYANNRTGIPDSIDIDFRPKIVNERKRIGDWEVDTMIGKNHKGVLITIDERVSKFRLVISLPNRKVRNINNAIEDLLLPIVDYVKTLTFDKGKSFVGIKSWQKVSNVILILLNHINLGKEDKTKMLMGFCDNISQKM